MGSSGSGSMVTFFSPDSVTRTLPPGVSPIVSRILAGITTWPLAEVLTIGITVHLFPRRLNIINQNITFDKEGVKVDPSTAWRCRRVVLSDGIVVGALWPRLRLGGVDPRRQGHEFRVGERYRVILDGG
jgi:hypothetical protein